MIGEANGRATTRRAAKWFSLRNASTVAAGADRGGLCAWLCLRLPRSAPVETRECTNICDG